jgi:hypothetical protein
MSDSPAFAAFIAAAAQLANPGKTSKVNAGAKSYWFAPLPEILDAARPILGAHKLAIRFPTAPQEGSLLVTCEVIYQDGTVVSASTVPCPLNANMQTLGSGMTYARRYALLAALGIAADDDDDGEATTRPAAQPQRPAMPRPAPDDRDTPLEAALRAKGITIEQFGRWRTQNGKPALTSLSAQDLTQITNWVNGLTAAKADEIRGAK